MNIQVEVFWVVTPCSVVVVYHHEEGNKTNLRNVGILPQNYTASQPRRPRFESLPQ